MLQDYLRCDAGANALADVENLARFMPQASLVSVNVSDRSWWWHNGCGRVSNDSWAFTADFRWLFSADTASALGTLALEVRASQFLQFEGYRYIFSASRWRKWHRSAGIPQHGLPRHGVSCKRGIVSHGYSGILVQC